MGPAIYGPSGLLFSARFIKFQGPCGHFEYKEDTSNCLSGSTYLADGEALVWPMVLKIFAEGDFFLADPTTNFGAFFPRGKKGRRSIFPDQRGYMSLWPNSAGYCWDFRKAKNYEDTLHFLQFLTQQGKINPLV